jgi:hypothetical protein
MSYPHANITNNSTEYRNENVTINREDCNIAAKENCSSVVAYLPRLTAGAIIIINASINQTVDLHDYVSKYPIIATYDRGSNTYHPYLSLFYQYNPNNIQLIILLSTLAAVFYAIALWHKKIKQARNARSHRNFVYHVIRDILAVYTDLTNNTLSAKILSFNTWESETVDVKHQIFDDYKDYKKIEEFYSELSIRDRYLSEQDINDGAIKIYNNRCRDLCTNIFTNMNWSKFRFENILTMDYILAIPFFILGSFFITFVCEGIPYSLWGFTNQDLLTFTFVFIARSAAAFFISMLILRKFHTLPSKEIKSTLKETKDTKEPLDYILSYSYSKWKLLVFSIIIMGFPSSFFGFPIIILTQFSSSPRLLSEADFINSIIVLTLLNVVFDIARMFILTFIVSKLIRERPLGMFVAMAMRGVVSLANAVIKRREAQETS